MANEKKIPIKLTRACWVPDRTEPGTEMDVTVEQAKRMIAAGVAVRNDPLPGE